MLLALPKQRLVCSSKHLVIKSVPALQRTIKYRLMATEAAPDLKESDVNIIKEGKAEVFFPKSVFYNPVQEFNRDLTNAVVSEYAKEFFEEKRNKGLKNADKGGEKVDIPDPAELKAGVKYKDGLRILEGLAASGLRSVRFALEIPGVKEIITNDYDKNAVNFIEKNIAKNNVGHLACGNFGDAAMLMYQNRQYECRFDVVDLDPYGSPSRFLDAAVQVVKDGGLLCITCTDMAVMSGNSGETAYTKYGSYAIRSPSCHEIALRTILHSLNSHAGRYSRYIVPILAVSVDFYIRVFVKVYTGQNKAKLSASKQAMIYRCSGCGAQTLQPLGSTIVTNNNTKYLPATGPTVGMTCEHCGHKHKLGGPIWADRLHDFDFVGKLIESVKSKKDLFKTSERMMGILSMAHEELPDVPLYYMAEELCNTIHCVVPTIMLFRSAIMNLGYEVSFSHAARNSIKTTAPMGVLWDILRTWVKDHPVSKKRLVPGSVVKAILDKEPTVAVSLETRADANPESRKKGLLRWQENPQKYWGPKPRAKRCGEGEQGGKEKKAKLEQVPSTTDDVEVKEKGTMEIGETTK